MCCTANGLLLLLKPGFSEMYSGSNEVGEQYQYITSIPLQDIAVHLDSLLARQFRTVLIFFIIMFDSKETLSNII